MAYCHSAEMDGVVHRVCSVLASFHISRMMEDRKNLSSSHKVGSHCKYWKNRIRGQNNFDKLDSLNQQGATQFGK